MNKFVSLTIATALSATLLAQPVLSQNIVVTPGTSQEQFVEDVSRDLNRQLKRASWGRQDASGEGIAIVRFTRSSQGEADNVSIYRGSGRRNLDRVAMRAVSRLNSLGRVPAGVGSDQVYQANIVFADDFYTGEKLRAELAEMEAARMASTDPAERMVFAFGSAAARPTS